LTLSSATIAPARFVSTFRSAPLRSLLLIAGIVVLERVYLGANFYTHLRPQHLLLPFVCIVPLIRVAHLRSDLDWLSNRFQRAQFDLPYFGAHLLAVLACAIISLPRFQSGSLSDTRVILAYGTYLIGVWFLLCAFFPAKALRDVVWKSRITWLQALMGAFAVWWLAGQSWSAWTDFSPLASLTFHAVKATLVVLLPNLDYDTTLFRIGGPHFHVRIYSACSGIEGLGLTLVFCSAWLWYFRSEIRFPRAFVLLPAALVAMWVLNVGRISALVMIGNAGAPDIAMGGFHSRSGWITFNALALAFCAVAAHIPWFLKDPPNAPSAVAPRNLAAVYLMPFLAILAASLLSRAASSGFESFYPLRFIFAAAVLWYFRAEYRSLQWKFGWTSPILGALVFVAWILWARAFGQLENPALAAGLASLSPAARLAWLALRVGCAVVTVPIAEELAFRGCAARRLMTAQFELVDLEKLSWFGMLGSSVLFGIMHGNQWFVGIVAGLGYAVAVRKNGRIGDGIAAHATTNALLAAWVLWRGQWGLW
jgi:exosortase E/protease (VPEID-CTERM system)